MDTTVVVVSSDVKDLDYISSEPGTEPVESEDDIDSEWPGEYESYDSIEVLPSNAEVCFFLCLFFPF